jgi:dTDP-4-dehydrorhamnose reductase
MILILGAKGMLGGCLMKAWGAKAVGWDREDFDLTRIEEYETKIASLKPELVVNCVAFNDVDGAESKTETAFLLNAKCVGRLAAVCKKLSLPLLHFSTNYVFAGREAPYLEVNLPDAKSVYGQSKAEGERLALENQPESYIIRTAVLFGPKGESELSKRTFVDMMLELGQKTATIKAVSDEINSLTFAPDLAAAVQAIWEQKPAFGIYHLTNSGHASWYELAKEIFKITGKSIELLPVPASEFPRPATRPYKSVLANTKLPTLRSWQIALKEYLDSGQ